jgi:two-component system phosphate regulon sensor histidine kinase PhoR
MTRVLNDAVILLDDNQCITWLNASSRDLLNLRKTDIGNPITNLIRNPLWVNYLNEGDHSLPLVLPSAENLQHRLEFRISHFGDGEYLIIVRDITRIFKLEQMRKDFVANVSHELRTPLTVISGYLETLDDTIEADNYWQKPVTQMQQQAQRMTTLINDLTMLSKLETEAVYQQQETVNLLVLLQTIIDAAQIISGDNNHELILECPPHLSLMGNSRELHSAFSNLVINAIKYSPPKRKITVSASTNHEAGINVSVIDNGYGIERHHIHRLTERFYRVDASRSINTGGTGLGLAIVKHILARYNAKLKITSRINQGSQFTAHFPQECVDDTDIKNQKNHSP